MNSIGILRAHAARIHPGHEETRGSVYAGQAGFGRAPGLGSALCFDGGLS